jgi:hypothetical protein
MLPFRCLSKNSATDNNHGDIYILEHKELSIVEHSPGGINGKICIKLRI